MANIEISLIFKTSNKQLEQTKFPVFWQKFSLCRGYSVQENIFRISVVQVCFLSSTEQTALWQPQNLFSPFFSFCKKTMIFFIEEKKEFAKIKKSSRPTAICSPGHSTGNNNYLKDGLRLKPTQRGNFPCFPCAVGGFIIKRLSLTYTKRYCEGNRLKPTQRGTVRGID